MVHHQGGLGLQESVLPKMRYKCLEKLYVLTVYKNLEVVKINNDTHKRAILSRVLQYST